MRFAIIAASSLLACTTDNRSYDRTCAPQCVLQVIAPPDFTFDWPQSDMHESDWLTVEPTDMHGGDSWTVHADMTAPGADMHERPDLASPVDMKRCNGNPPQAFCDNCQAKYCVCFNDNGNWIWICG